MGVINGYNNSINEEIGSDSEDSDYLNFEVFFQKEKAKKNKFNNKSVYL